MNHFSFNFDPSDFENGMSFDPKMAGEIFSQLGNMISGLGGALQNPSSDPMASSSELAKKSCRENIPQEKAITAKEKESVEQCFSLANTWLDAVTILPANTLASQAWRARDWAFNTLDGWLQLCQPLAVKTFSILPEDLPESGQQLSAIINEISSKISSYGIGAQLGKVLSQVAQESLTSADAGIILHSDPAPALLPRNITKLAESLSLPEDELQYYLAAREAAHHRLHHYAPWLNPLIIHLIEQYAQAISLDYDSLQSALSEIDFNSGIDENSFNEILGEHIGKSITSETQDNIRQKLHSILALIEGWVSVVVEEAVTERLPSSVVLAEVMHRRRVSGNSADQALANLIGVELRPHQIKEAADLFRSIGVDYSVEQRDKIWCHQDIIPRPEEIADSSLFISRYLDTQTKDAIDKELEAFFNSHKPPTE